MAPTWLDQNTLMFVRPITSSEKTTGLGTPGLRSPWTCLVWCHGVIACIPINAGKDLSSFLFFFLYVPDAEPGVFILSIMLRSIWNA